MTNLRIPQYGFTLIELMVSLALGLIIMLAATQLFITNQLSFNLQRGMGNVQENGRFAIDYINSTVRSSEYSSATTADEYLNAGVITDITQVPGLDDADFVSLNDETALGVGSSDQLVVRQWVSAEMTNFRDCEGNVCPYRTFCCVALFC